MRSKFPLSTASVAIAIALGVAIGFVINSVIAGIGIGVFMVMAMWISQARAKRKCQTLPRED